MNALPIRLFVAGLVLASLLALAPEARAQACAPFANNQIQLAEDRAAQADFAGAMRVLNVTIRDCDLPRVRNKLADIAEQWYTYVNRRGSSRALREFMDTMENQPNLPPDAQERTRSRMVTSMTNLLEMRVEAENYEGSYEVCTAFPSLSRSTFELHHYCGTAAMNVKAYGRAIESFGRMLNNWDEDQNYTTWDATAKNLETLYLRTTRFSEGYELSKRLVLRDPSRENLESSLIAARGKFLTPLAQMGGVLFDGVASDRSIAHAKAQMQRISFPPFVKSVYIMTQERRRDAVFHGADFTALPSTEAIEKGTGDVFLVRPDTSSSQQGLAWIASPIDAGYFVVQFDLSINREEGILLDELARNIQSEVMWRALYEYEFSKLFPALGGGTGTLLGAAYLEDKPLEPYQRIIDRLPTLRYYAIQRADEQGRVVRSYSFSRASLNYPSGLWERSTEAQALFHHEVGLEGTPIREVVWPIYEDGARLGVTRVGVAMDYQSATN
jgi:tetratricopeptide (TPR) repeat protein